MSKTTKLTATFEGVTVSRRTAHAYTHVVFGLRSGELEARRVEETLAARRRERALAREAVEFLRRGETPPAGHALLEVTSANGYHRFSRWDNAARETNDFGRTFRTLTVAEAEAKIAKYADTNADYERRLAAHAAEHRAAGERWVAVSWHHRLDLAVKGVEAARAYDIYTRFEIVPVNAQEAK